jgi:hypothetical protein
MIEEHAVLLLLKLSGHASLIEIPQKATSDLISVAYFTTEQKCNEENINCVKAVVVQEFHL